ncbi:hypothetical protein FQA39_LY07989 [Lamprigera yunnana]|nr:hypothetical protein FQA39_LY07989 [Lamprigera yunnana]
MKFTVTIVAAFVLHLAQSASFGNGDRNMWERSGKFEGDMVLLPEQKNGIIADRYRWPNREVPYEISNEYTDDQVQFIKDTLAKEYARTCVTVRPRTEADKDYVYVTSASSGCFSSVGRVGGKQILNLDKDGCVWYSIIVHEFLHAIGFYHQQSATERDDYVTINWENIEEGKAYNFDKYGTDYITSYGLTYDYKSIMHYERKAFSKNGGDTITPHENVEIGIYENLSDIDIEKISKMFQC